MKRIQIGKSKIDGNGIIALENIKKGERIAYIHGLLVHRRIRSEHESLKTMHWIGAGKNIWIKSEQPFKSINHSCEPNAVIIGTRTVIAFKDIRLGDEITMDYSLTDSDPLWSIDCNCGSKNCRGRIGAIFTLPPNVFNKYLNFIPKYFQRAYERQRALSHGR